MSKDIKENPLIFDFGSGKYVIIYSNCDDWYLEEKVKGSKYPGTRKYYLNNEWFYNTLKNKEYGIYKFASLFEYDCNFKKGQLFIKKYSEEFEDEVKGCGMDTFIFMTEVFAQSATKNPNIHWW